MFEKQVKTKDLQEPKLFRTLIRGFLDIHSHRYFRRGFFVLLVLHMITILIPNLDLGIHIPSSSKPLLEFFYRIWPLPTFKMTNFMNDEATLNANNLFFKSFEILVILLYVVDLVPKIFVWKNSVAWKVMNIVVVTLMVLQVPLTIIGYMEAGKRIDQLKIRTLSILITFLLVMEIFSIREQKTLRTSKSKRSIQKQSSETFALRKSSVSQGLKEYSWAEIIKHDKPGDCWVVVHGKVYDVTEFVSDHPGGPMIYDGAGGDCTSMWESYHPLALVKNGPPQKYLIGQVRNYADFYSWEGDFFYKLKEKVEAKIPAKNRRNEPTLIIKGILIIISWFIALYYWTTRYDLITTLIFSFISGMVGVNVMHDGNHSAWSSNKYLTYIAGYTLDLVGSTSVVYRRSHNFGHHGCVNHFELDRAFDTTYPLYRLHKFQRWMPIHKYQHIYVWLIYGMVNFGDVFGTFDELTWMSNYPTRRGHVTKLSYFTQVIAKIWWISHTMIIPSFIHGWYHVFPLWFLYMMVFSYCYDLFFAVNHWTEEAAQVDNSNISNSNWGVLQVKSYIKNFI